MIIIIIVFLNLRHMFRNISNIICQIGNSLHRLLSGIVDCLYRLIGLFYLVKKFLGHMCKILHFIKHDLRIVLIFTSNGYKFCITSNRTFLHETYHIVCLVCQITDCRNNGVGNLFNLTCSRTRTCCKFCNLICNNRKSFTGLSCTCCLNGSIQCK